MTQLVEYLPGMHESRVLSPPLHKIKHGSTFLKSQHSGGRGFVVQSHSRDTKVSGQRGLHMTLSQTVTIIG